MQTDLTTENWQLTSIRAWTYLVWLSFQRQGRAHLMVWIALGLLGFSLLLIALNTQAGRWTMAHWPWPRNGPTMGQYQEGVAKVALEPWTEVDAAALHMEAGLFQVAIEQASGFFVFSNYFVLSVFCTFLLPLWSLSFATEGLGREREAHNLLWVLTRPLSRPAIYLAKLAALVPWCLALNVGGFALLCLAAGAPGQLAFHIYWPAVLAGTLAFASLFHLLGACVRRPAIVALLYAFFLETVMSNMPGHARRFSISYYIRSLMFDRAHEFGIFPERSPLEVAVGGGTAVLVLAGVTFACAVLGALVFARNEYLDLS